MLTHIPLQTDMTLYDAGSRSSEIRALTLIYFLYDLFFNLKLERAVFGAFA